MSSLHLEHAITRETAVMTSKFQLPDDRLADDSQVSNLHKVFVVSILYSSV